MIKNPFNNSNGFTMIELLITMLIFGIGFLALAKLQGSILINESISQQRRVALDLTQNKIEELRLFEPAGASSDTYSNILSGNQITTMGNTSYTLNWAVVTNTSPNYKDVDVTCTWTTQTGVNASITLSTVIGDIDASDVASSIQDTGNAGAVQPPLP